MAKMAHATVLSGVPNTVFCQTKTMRRAAPTFKSLAALTGAFFFFACTVQVAFVAGSTGRMRLGFAKTEPVQSTNVTVLEREANTEGGEQMSTVSADPEMYEDVSEVVGRTTNSRKTSHRRASRSAALSPQKRSRAKLISAAMVGVLLAAAAGLGQVLHERQKLEKQIVAGAGETQERLVEETETRKRSSAAAIIGGIVIAGLAVALGVSLLELAPEPTPLPPAVEVKSAAVTKQP